MIVDSLEDLQTFKDWQRDSEIKFLTENRDKIPPVPAAGRASGGAAGNSMGD